MSQSMTRDELIKLAQEVANAEHQHCPLIAACIVSSVAAGDFTPASDVDILMFAADGKSRPIIYRRLVEGRVVEWMILAKGDLGNVEAILGDAGLTHDILTAVILQDDGDWLEKIQREVISRYKEPVGIQLRVANQIDRIRGALEQMSAQVQQGRILLAQRSHVSLLKSVFGLPRALLNVRCSMSRAVPFCREAVEALACSNYLADALEVFGAAGIDASLVRGLHVLAERIIASSGFTLSEQAIRLRHLEGAHWLLQHGEPADAVWPLYFWSSVNVEEAGGESNESAWADWSRFASVLDIGTKEDLNRKVDLAGSLIHLAVNLAESANDHPTPV